MQRVLFVCTGNTCRSPMAAGLFGKILQEKGKTGMEITSAGLAAIDGAPASAEAVEVMRRTGVDLSGHRARRLTREMVITANLVLTMTRRQKDAVLTLAPEAEGKVFTLQELAGSFAVDMETDTAGTNGRRQEGEYPRAAGKSRKTADEGTRAADERTKTTVRPCAGENRQAQEDILDPFGGDLQTYENTARQIERCLLMIANGMMKKNEQQLKIAVASDHAGFPLKEEILRFLAERGFDYHDFGVYSPESVDYTDQAELVARKVAAGEYDRGILVCGTGIGVSIAANKIKGIRAALCHDVFSARMARNHNDSNILALGARVIGVGPALAIVEAYLSAEFEGGRHQKRVDKINKLEG
ncbi:MAG TPA: ribose 5-phosphate isomerase B [Firmicutes bacterium]|jgi:ribose 5-phosphate isomerase B|nr:ribose 5-phosphate isomerase B [Bacillota bacterium]